MTNVSGSVSPLVNSIPPLLGASLIELTSWIQQQGQPAYRGRQLHGWIYQKGVRSLSEISVFPKQWRNTLADVPIGRSKLHYRLEAKDGTVKYLLQLSDGQIIETVGIPTPKRLTVCVSSQVGCPMACDFCATGKGGFTRNLARHEIVDQVLTVREDFQQRCSAVLGVSPMSDCIKKRVSNVVFMGMGEPLLNTEAVVGAVKSLNQDLGIGARSLTISTVGIPGRIRQLAQHQLQVTLAVSLHASNQQLREQLIPSAKHYPLKALLDECRDYVNLTSRRVTFEYILLGGLNDSQKHAVELANNLRGFQSHVNLIPYNPISEVDYQRPNYRRIQGFVEALKQQHIAVSVRHSRGLDKDAACGQLRASRSN
ncbi:23S rRNA (adenine(2503)-C(2))-methyltransferase RlmN [Moorena producens JHB]|uniref:Probable dual-specificity RNA methyltransferase RlmN n=1 Tax=Moorena producens (strain JHB) TaxID=1454205 RepID=A0A1D9GAP7_MOOP1|nr:23S rRNA (adenine(2503)-C(2))-methyltransferase RlmN [Moorena producens]AOY84722.1 23S rRNA (adenine(2503)-C(2))-methyltransferase RlmN [Moorena producens JHB]